MKKTAIFILLFVLFFSGAFSMHFFDDDFYFLKRSSFHSLSQLLNIFVPSQGTFYRPLSSELFYLVIRNTGVIAGKILVFAVFLAGIYFLYRIMQKLAGHTLAVLSVIMYSFHFSHLFQLYWFATFQEVAMYTALMASFSFFLNRRYAPAAGVFFVSLFCKEQAALYPLFIIIYLVLFQGKKARRSDLYFAAASFLMSALFIPFYLTAMKTTITLPEYRIHLSPRLVFNNTVWYSLWSLGLPSMMSDYMTSLTRPPLPQFFRFFQNPFFTAYFVLTLCFLAVLSLSAIYVVVIQRRRPNPKKSLFLVLGYLLFLAPTLPIFHKWMVRLTVPLVFVSIAEAFIIASLYKSSVGRKLVYAMVGLYLVFNFLGVKVHEEISTYKLETRISKNADSIFQAKHGAILAAGRVAIVDDSGKEMSAWAGVDKLKITFAGQNAAAYYFPEKNIDFVYMEKGTRPPDSAVTVPASAFFK